MAPGSRLQQLMLAACLSAASGFAVAEGYFPMFAAWPQPGGPGSPITLTYSYSNLFDGSLVDPTNQLPLPVATLRSAIETAFSDYAAFLPIHFVEQVDTGPLPESGEYDPAGHANIRIGQVPHVDGANAYAYFPFDAASGLAGDIVFNANRFGSGWTAVLFYAVAQHEIGHTLGMGHFVSGSQAATAAPIGESAYPGPVFPIDPAAVLALQTVYGTGTGSVSPIPLPPAIALFIPAVAVLSRRSRRSRKCTCD